MNLRIYFSLLLFYLFAFSSCVKDTSEYLSQEKKDVEIDQYDTVAVTPGGTEGELQPGIHLVKLDVETKGIATVRRFKYFMPVSIDKSKPISLIFDFHGSYGAGQDPIANVSMSQPLLQLAIKQNCIIAIPAGEDTGSAVNWQNSDNHFPFVDAMVDFFKNQTPKIDVNRIYTCGHSSGAIFSYVLAFYRSDIFAAAVPVAGQMKIQDSEVAPNRVVPIRAFNAKKDESVIASAVVDNITVWANKVAGYFPADAVYSDTLYIDNYKPYLTKKWNGGKGDIELFMIEDEGHSINWTRIMPLMWEFMAAHPKNVSSSGLYITSALKRFDAVEGQTLKSEIRYSEGASVSIVSAPSDWTVTLSGNILNVKAPNDFFGATTINRKGEIKLSVSGNGSTASLSLPYTLAAPKAYYEVGDLIYDADFKPTGVVFWVNPSNIKEAKIIALEHTTKQFGAVGANFFTPSYTDGYGNTLALIAQNKTLATKLTATTSAFVYAYEYKASVGNTIGWYLPAVDELKALDANLTAVNNALKTHGTALEIASSSGSYYLSSTMLKNGTSKQFQTFDFNTNPSWHGYYPLTANASDNSAYVATRPIKKVTK
ncbi:alpha/beta hydrolase family esterase [Sphingobacterium tabacisoli]|uniref:Alpha/beta hydrolase family esterase n=1 Tax=Sphingobacterium tabacisoli TaxID=2044855 RepID=A0ABW5KYW4_9SPHI|nr:dienelactone hydrolase family protein [Sphingobacterium tabacisoli]